MTFGAVIAPGYGGSSEQPIVVHMGQRLEALGFRVKRVSFSRGRPAGDYGPEMLDVVRARDELLQMDDVGQVALVGRSFGGRICARVAALEPQDLGALVLLGHPIAPPNRPRPEDEAALEAVTCPTLIVQGERDALGPLEVLQRIARVNPSIELCVLPGVGHQFGARQSDGLDRAAAWLQEVLGRT